MNKENEQDNLQRQVDANPYVEFAKEEGFDALRHATLQRSFLLTNNDRH